jgi:elongation factor P
LPLGSGAVRDPALDPVEEQLEAALEALGAARSLDQLAEHLSRVAAREHGRHVRELRGVELREPAAVPGDVPWPLAHPVASSFAWRAPLLAVAVPSRCGGSRRRRRADRRAPITLFATRRAGQPDFHMISTNQFKNGNHIEVEGTVFKILEFQHVKPGKGGAFVRTKLRRASDGAVIDRTFRAGEKFRPVRTEARKMQFLYADGADAHFMDEQSFEQLPIPETSIQDQLRWIKPSETVDLLFIDGRPSDVQLAASVELEVTHTEPGVRGDTASGGGNKPATLETGATIQVPLFVNIGDRVKVDTRAGSYMSRA